MKQTKKTNDIQNSYNPSVGLPILFILLTTISNHQKEDFGTIISK